MKKIVILDFDGTIADTKPVILETFHRTFDVEGLPQSTDTQISSTIGLPLLEAFPVLCPMNHDKAEKCVNTYREIFENVNREIKPQLFPHVTDTLRRLHALGVICSIATSRGYASATSFMQSFGLNDIITYIVAAENVSHAKPNPEPVTKTLHHFSIEAKDAVVVGDTHFDIHMGRNAGCMTIGVSYGYGSKESLLEAGADFIIGDFSKLTLFIADALSKGA